MGLFATLESLCHHPLNRSAPLSALWRFGRWQISQRIWPRRVVTPWVGDTRLLVGGGETGLTGNVYCGLHEFADMAFVLHYLRAEDRFVDVGANAGSYTVLAAGAVGALAIAIEPVPSTFERLLDNVNVNRLAARVDCLNRGAGARPGALRFTTDRDTTNRALAESEAVGESVVVPVCRLDDVVPRDRCAMLKLDVEGYEGPVIAGATELLRSGCVQALLVEMNGSSNRYGHDDQQLHEVIVEHGFSAHVYAPFERLLRPLQAHRNGNVLYLRHPETAQQRVRAAPAARIHGRLL